MRVYLHSRRSFLDFSTLGAVNYHVRLFSRSVEENEDQKTLRTIAPQLLISLPARRAVKSSSMRLLLPTKVMSTRSLSVLWLVAPARSSLFLAALMTVWGSKALELGGSYRKEGRVSTTNLAKHDLLDLATGNKEPRDRRHRTERPRLFSAPVWCL